MESLKPPKLSTTTTTSQAAKGELAERLFVAQVLAHGLDIAEPVVDKNGYDFLVFPEDERRTPHRVQVKAGTMKNEKSAILSTGSSARGQKKTSYADKGVDFFAFCLLPIGEWYIIPCDHPDIQNTTSIYLKEDDVKWSEFKNQWQNLKQKAWQRNPYRG